MVDVYVDGGLLKATPTEAPGAYWSIGLKDDSGFRVIHRAPRDTRYRTSVEAEVAALMDVLRVLEEELPGEKARIFMDCKSVVDSVRSHRPIGKKGKNKLHALHQDVLAVWDRLRGLGRHLQIAWVSSTVMHEMLGH